MLRRVLPPARLTEYSAKSAPGTPGAVVISAIRAPVPPERSAKTEQRAFARPVLGTADNQKTSWV